MGPASSTALNLIGCENPTFPSPDPVLDRELVLHALSELGNVRHAFADGGEWHS